MDDKKLVILCVTGIAICAMFKISNPEIIITSIISGLFGVAVGIALPKSKNP